MDERTRTFDRGESIDAIYLDFAKAFDTVPHKRLIGKLESLVIKGLNLSLVESFMCNRMQQVNVNGTKSKW